MPYTPAQCICDVKTPLQAIDQAFVTAQRKGQSAIPACSSEPSWSGLGSWPCLHRGRCCQRSGPWPLGCQPAHSCWSPWTLLSAPAAHTSDTCHQAPGQPCAATLAKMTFASQAAASGPSSGFARQSPCDCLAASP